LTANLLGLLTSSTDPFITRQLFVAQIDDAAKRPDGAKAKGARTQVLCRVCCGGCDRGTSWRVASCHAMSSHVT
jgi:hypothetical protein